MHRPILWILAPALAFAQAGTLRGVLTLAEGGPLADFPIAIARTPPPVFDPKFVPWTRTVFTNADGAFEFAGVPEGTYRVCPQKSIPGYLNPCFWNESAAAQRVAAGQPTAVVALRLVRSQAQVIRVEDPAGLLGQARVPNRGGPVAAPRNAIVLGMFTPAGYFLNGRLAREVGTAGSARPSISSAVEPLRRSWYRFRAYWPPALPLAGSSPLVDPDRTTADSSGRGTSAVGASPSIGAPVVVTMDQG